MKLIDFRQKPKEDRSTVKNIINLLLVLFTTFYIIKYNSKMYHVDTMGFGLAGIMYALRYIPIIVTAAVGGAVPAMLSVLFVFVHNSIQFNSFSYLTFIYLLVACDVDVLSKNKWFNRVYKIIPVTIFLMLTTGLFWGVIMLLLSDYGIYTITLRQCVLLFMNELPGSLAGTIIVYCLIRYIPDKYLLYFGNGKYYVDPELLDEDEKYVVEGKSRISKVIMNIIVIEALVLGIFAEIASNTLIPTMRQYEPVSAPAQRSRFADVNSSDRIESLITIDLLTESQEESSYLQSLVRGDENSVMNLKFSLRLAMVISIVVIPLAVFMNRYAQARIARPIRQLSKAMDQIYNSSDAMLATSTRAIHGLDIRTNDEIEELYHSADLTVYRLVEYIDIVKKRQNIEDQLRVAQSASEAKSRFLSNISHEIRTPINAVLGFDEMIIRESKDKDILGYAMDIQSSGKTLLSLINDILDFSKIEAGKMEIIPVEYEIGSMLNDIVNMSEFKAKEKNLSLNVIVNENIPHVLYGDEIRIKQCVINIITNAVKYTEAGSVDLHVNYELVEDTNTDVEEERDSILLNIAVADTGIGIREEDMDKLMSAFERIDEKKNRTIEGTGLGISIVTSLLDMMGSKLEVKSEYGVGSEFSFSVKQEVVDWEPVGDFASRMRESKLSTGTYKENFHAPDAHILVVDDTRTNLTVIEGLLKQTKIQVDTATSGMDTLELVKKNRYHIIFLDHRMPEMDGIQTFHAMQTIEDNLNKETPVIALTANAISGSREMYLREGFTGYMSKPVDPQKLEEMILAYLPKDLVFKPGDEGYIHEEDTGDDDEKAVMQELLKISGVDIKEAIGRCGSAVVAKNVMKDFWLAIDERAGLIEKYESEKNIKDYTIYVHGLKSSAKAIGAIDLSEKAKYLEKCGNSGNIDEIEKLTPDLLELYRSYIGRLQPLVDNDDSDKPEISSDELEGAFASIKEFVSASFFDSADDIMKMLEDYRIPAEYRDKYHEVKKLLAAVDRDGLLNVL